MDVSPIGVDVVETAPVAVPFFMDGAVSKPECARCPDVCLYEYLFVALRATSCHEVRAGLVAAAAEDSCARTRAIIEERLDAGRTPDQVAVDLGLTPGEIHTIFFC